MHKTSLFRNARSRVCRCGLACSYAPATTSVKPRRSFSKRPSPPDLPEQTYRHRLMNFPLETWKMHPDLKYYIRPCIADLVDPSRPVTSRAWTTSFSVLFMGTGAGHVSPLRNPSATMLRVKGQSFLFDAGEGIQLQIMLSKVTVSDITKIFITHMHGDHIFGLPSILLALQGVATGQGPTTIKIYGPVGLYNYIAMSLSLSGSEINKLRVEVYELRTESVLTQRKWEHSGATNNYPEFRHRGLIRRYIPQNPDGTWTLEQPTEITSPELAHLYHSQPQGFYIKAALLNHVPNMQTLGYTVEEPYTLPRKLDIEKALAAGVTDSAKYRLLKSGFPVSNDNDATTVNADDVVFPKHRFTRKLAYLGDCCGVPMPMAELCRNADVLVHEATLLSKSTGRRVTAGGHSTAAMAGQFAGHVGARVLALNHISQSHAYAQHFHQIVEEATNAVSGNTRVQLAYDFMEIMIPRVGFREEAFLEENQKIGGKQDGQPKVESSESEHEPDEQEPDDEDVRWS